MKFKVTFRPYPAGIGSRTHDELWELEADSQKQALDDFYSRPDFNPEWRVVHVEEVDAQNSTDQDGSIRPEAGPDEHAEQPIPGGVYGGTRTE